MRATEALTRLHRCDKQHENILCWVIWLTLKYRRTFATDVIFDFAALLKKQKGLDILCELSVLSERYTGYIRCSLKGAKMLVSVGIDPGTYRLQS